ncbi:hypothetical protein MIR68_007713 [Amoeboaphelidium protococcarum]|nr:hypothetical protein MIR68_007713 [Amoeboaphelidium protococcarum]
MINSITVRVIKNFEYQTFKTLVVHNVDEQQQVQAFRKMCIEEIQKHIQQNNQWKIMFGNVNLQKLNTLKIYHVPHKSKTSSLIINIGDDDTLCLKDETRPLSFYGIGTDYEVSLFNREEYEQYRDNPNKQKRWE